MCTNLYAFEVATRLMACHKYFFLNQEKIMEINFFIQKKKHEKKIFKNTKESKYVIAWWPFRWFFLSSHNQPASLPKIYSPISPTAECLHFIERKIRHCFMAYTVKLFLSSFSTRNTCDRNGIFVEWNTNGWCSAAISNRELERARRECIL